jgi:X-X-X-Leu-X-X-Gly heptad repeat protein
MVKQELLRYLDETIAIESECYAVERMIEETERMRDGYIEEPSVPIKSSHSAPTQARTLPLPNPNANYLDKYDKWEFIKNAAGATFLIGIPLSLVLLIWLYKMVALWLVCSVFLIASIGTVLFVTEAKAVNKKRYQKALEDIKKKNLMTEYNNKNALKWYNEAQRTHKEHTEKYQQDLASIRRYNQSAKLQNGTINEVQQTLRHQLNTLSGTKDRLYALNVIYPKYHNLVAMTSFYEYFDSGRCAELEGAQGAYNLFEIEKRMDIIIYKMDMILARLKKIAENQYRLYTEMVRVNDNVEHLAAGLTKKLQEVFNGQAALADGVAQANANSRALASGINSLSEYVQRLGAVNAKALNYLAARK